MYHKNISYRRMQRRNHIASRKKLCRAKEIEHPKKDIGGYVYTDWSVDLPGAWYKFDGQFAKSKLYGTSKPRKKFHRPSEKQIREESRAEDAIREYERIQEEQFEYPDDYDYDAWWDDYNLSIQDEADCYESSRWDNEDWMSDRWLEDDEYDSDPEYEAFVFESRYLANCG